MRKGQRVKFKIYDSLFKDWIEGFGIVVSHHIYNLWKVKPDANPRLSGGIMILHKNVMETG